MSEEKKVEVTETMEEIIKKIENMTVLELSNLVKTLEERFGVTASAPVAVAVGGAGAAEGAAEVKKDSFTVVLTSFGANKVSVIKEVRTITALGLKEAKDLVDTLPKPLKEGVTKEEVDKIKATMEAAGATVEIK